MWEPRSRFRKWLGLVAMAILWIVGPIVGQLFNHPEGGFLLFTFLSLPVWVLIAGDSFGNVKTKDRFKQIWRDPAYKELKIQIIALGVILSVGILTVAIGLLTGRMTYP
jgi:hypothetical protein